MGRFQEGANGVGLSPHIQCLRPVHRSMAQAVALGNMKPQELVQNYGYTAGQISRIMGSPAFLAEVTRIEREKEIINFDLAKDIQAMTLKAIQVLDEDLEMDPETLSARKVRQTAALEVLGITGIRKTGGGGVHVYNNFASKEGAKAVSELDEEEVRDEILQLTHGTDGTYS